MGKHVTEAEVLACLRAGWPMRFLPQHMSGIRTPWDPAGQTRDLWLGQFRSDDHPDLELDWASMMLWEMDKVRCVETDDGVGIFVLTENAPAYAQSWADFRAEQEAM